MLLSVEPSLRPLCEGEGRRSLSSTGENDTTVSLLVADVPFSLSCRIGVSPSLGPEGFNESLETGAVGAFRVDAISANMPRVMGD